MKRSAGGAPSERADVLVIGAGASGGVASARLAEAGLRVICLEQGGWQNASDYPGDRPTWGLEMGKQWNFNPNVRGRLDDYPCEVSDADVYPQMFNAVGGSTILWAAQWIRFLPSDFRARTLDGVGDDWPFAYEELQPYYEEVEVEFGVSGLAGDPTYPPGKGPPLPPLPIGKLGRKAAEGMNELGWQWWPGAQAIPSRDYRNQKQCVRFGTCTTGCPEGAKASTDLTHWPTALKHDAKVVTGARVREITTNGKGLATGAVYVDRDGAEHHQQADSVILAANGVGTPRLLLLSRSSRFPDGLANSSGLVGKRLMMHPHVGVIGVYDEMLESWLGPAGITIQSMHWYETEPDRGFVRGGRWNAYPMGGPLGVRPPAGEEGFDDAWGESHHTRMRERLGRMFEWGLIAEDLPEESNSVTLDPELVDSDGIPAPKITYRIAENSRRLLDFHAARAQEAHEAAGAADVFVKTMMPDCGWHLMGTATMGTDPATSVVDEYGRAHDVPNLFIYDGSVFPTSSGCNPTATISAVALRCVTHLIEKAPLQAVPA